MCISNVCVSITLLHLKLLKKKKKEGVVLTLMIVFPQNPYFETLTASVMVWCVCSATQSCPTLCDPMGCSPTGSSVHGILQARILEWVAFPFSRGSS